MEEVREQMKTEVEVGDTRAFYSNKGIDAF